MQHILTNEERKQIVNQIKKKASEGIETMETDFSDKPSKVNGNCSTPLQDVAS